MIRLTTFGALSLEGPNPKACRAIVRQPKRLALLVRLALAGGGRFVSRDTLLGLFWPDYDESRARNALNQALYHLRKHLGPGIVISRGGRLATSSSELWCDAAEFCAALEDGRDSDALALYAGDLLPGFFVDDAPEFDPWLSRERNRMRRAATEAATRLCSAAAAHQDRAGVARWAFRAVDLAQDEGTVHAAVGALSAMGDQAAAANLIDRFEARVSTDLGLAVSPELRSLATPRPRTAGDTPPPAHEAAARADPSPVAGATAPLEPGSERGGGEAIGSAGRGGGGSRTARLALVVLLAVAVSAAALYAWSRAAAGHPRLGPDIDTDVAVEVEPFADPTGRARLQGLSGALTSALIDRLAGVDGLRVAVAGPAGADSTSPDFRTAGEVLEKGDSVEASVRLLDAASGTVLSVHSSRHAGSGVSALADALASDLSVSLRSRLGLEVRQREAMAGTRSPNAWRLYEQGISGFDKALQLSIAGNPAAAIRALELADSSLSDAAAADTAWVSPPLARAKAALRSAFESYMGQDAGASEALFRSLGMADRAVGLAPANARAFEARGEARYWMALVGGVAADSARRLLSSAERDLRTSVDLGPRRASAWTLLSSVLLARGDFAGAYLAADRAFHSDPYLDKQLEILSRLYETAYEVGDDSSAVAWCDELGRRFQGSPPATSCSLRVLAGNARGAGAVDDAWDALRSMRNPDGPRADQVEAVMRGEVALVIARAGLRDSAAAVLQRARGGHEKYAELVPVEAEVRIALGEPEQAARLLSGYIAQHPVWQAGIWKSRRFRAIEEQVAPSHHSPPPDSQQ